MRRPVKAKTKVIAHRKKVSDRQQRTLRSRFGEENIYLTSSLEDAALFAKNPAKEGYHEILVVGGDGLFSRAINGYLENNSRPQQVSFGLIPVGSGNDFARSFDIPFRFEKALDHFECTEAKPIDVCKIRYTGLEGRPRDGYFINAAGLGCIPLVVENFNRLRLIRHPAMYSALALLDSYRYDSAQIEIRDGKGRLFSGPIRFVSLTNGKYAGGGIQFGRHAFADDGLFQIKIAHSLPKWKTALLCFKFATVGIEEHPNMVDFFVDRAKITTPEEKPVLIEADGEVLGKLPAEISIFHHHLLFHGKADKGASQHPKQ
jgi:diacylglycerol kinase (ATP)